MLYGVLCTSFALALVHGIYLAGAFSGTDLVHLRYVAQLRALLLAIAVFFVAYTYLRPGALVRPWVIAATAWLLVPLVAAFFIPLAWLLLLGFVVWWGGVLALTIAGARRTAAPIYRNDLFYWDSSIVLLIGGGVLLLIEHPVPAAPLLVLGFGLVSYTVLRPRLPDAHFVLRSALLFVIFSLASVAVYIAAFLVVDVLFLAWPGYSILYRGLVFALVLAVLINPFLRLVENRLANRIAAAEYDIPVILGEYSHSIAGVVDRKSLAKVIARVLSEVLDVRRVFLFTVERCPSGKGVGIFQLEGVQGTSGAEPEPLNLPESSPLAQYFAGGRGSLLRQQFITEKRFSVVSEGIHRWMDALQSEVLVAIYREGEWIGLLSIGPRASGAGYDSAALELVQALADQTAVAMDSIQRVTSLMALNAELRDSLALQQAENRKLLGVDKTRTGSIELASYELRQTLSRISESSLVLLQDASLLQNPFYSDLLSKIVSGTERLQEIVDTMEDAVEAGSGIPESRKQQVALYPLLDAVLDDLGYGAADRKQFHIDDSIWDLPAVVVDDDALHKVFHHLVRYAVQQTPEEGGVIITARALSPKEAVNARGAVEVIVGSTGSEDPDPLGQEASYEKFLQVEDTEAPSSHRESGLGSKLLAIQAIVEAEGGSIRVDILGRGKMPGPGIRYVVRLPLPSPPSNQEQTA